MLLAGDVGGTKTLLGLFERAPRRPVPVVIHIYSTNEFGSFGEILDRFERDVRPVPAFEAVVVGVAGPVIDQTARLTNIVWDISASEICARYHTPRVRLLNDLEAMANSVSVLGADELVDLQTGEAHPEGNAVVIAAGTGLGEAYLHRVNGRFHPVASEAGHADFAPRTDREIELLRALRTIYGRAEVEHVLSGRGLLNLYRFTHGAEACDVLNGVPQGQEPAAISHGGLTGRCPQCVEVMDLFVDTYGSEAGNLALRGVATGGVFVGGGIAPKILPALRRGTFMSAFVAKEPMSELLSRIPVKVILNADAGIIGAAVLANELSGDPHLS
jgi:glucokinase